MTMSHIVTNKLSLLLAVVGIFATACKGNNCEEPVPTPENSKIYYTTIDGKRLFPYTIEASVYGAMLVSNEYINGQGVLTFDDTVISIGTDAFYECYRLASIIIPEGVTEIESTAFVGCLFIKDNFINKSSLNEVEHDHWGARLFDVIQEDGLCINGTTVAGCRPTATSITIPDNITDTERYAFYNCNSLASVYCKPTIPPTGGISRPFHLTSEWTIYVPMASIEAYKTADNWKDCADYIVGYDF